MTPSITCTATEASETVTGPQRERPEDYLADWKEREALAEGMIPLIGQLCRRNIRVTVYGRSLVNRSVIDIMKAHRFVRQVEQNELSEFESFPILEAIAKRSLKPCIIDLGRLAVRYMERGAPPMSEYLDQSLEAVAGFEIQDHPPSDIALFGFGRIGRLLTRILIAESGSRPYQLKAIAVRSHGKQDLIKRASLLRRDSVHGSFRGTIRVDEGLRALVINGNVVRFIDAGSSPDQIDYASVGISEGLLIDTSGQWRDETSLSQHLRAPGIAKVVLTAPAHGVKNIVYGINNDQLETRDSLIAAASCTTNAIVPVLKLVNDYFGIRQGHVETVHAYTNDQNLTDNYHAKSRRGRSAPMNIVITETGAASAITKALPELEGKITGNAIRVPTPNVSLAILNLTVEADVDRTALNGHLRRAALHSRYSDILDYTESPDIVSSDFVGSTAACIIDSHATIAQGNHCVIYAWYDNEYGYCWQVSRLARQILGLELPEIPEPVLN